MVQLSFSTLQVWVLVVVAYWRMMGGNQYESLKKIK